MNIQRVKQQLVNKQIELAKYRDDLREMVANVTDVLSDVEDAEDELQTAIRALEDASDKLSQLQ